MVYDAAALPLESLFAPVARATEVLARLDERLARSSVRDGWLERQNFADAAAVLWLEGELVHLEDLVLHDAHMDVRAPTHELTRAHAVLRARRQILARAADWALGREGLRQLTGRGSLAAPAENGREGDGGPLLAVGLDESMEADDPDPLGEEFAAIDAVLERTSKVLEGGGVPARREAASQSDRPGLVYDLDWDEDARLAEWQDVLAATRQLPVVLRAAILLDAWFEIEVLQHATWLGPLLVAALLRQEGLCASHLVCLHTGAKNIPRERRRARLRNDRLLAFVDAIQDAALTGLREHDRLVLAKSQMERRLRERRVSSRLPDLVELVLSRPLVSTGIIQARLKVSKQGALNLISELGLREMTGRGRFRAWGVV
ncbi:MULTISPECIES: RHE_PE00001 family protein [unclassified Mesorhizobium]|uniref:RHE_PE00001 family protein n=1 Tax=unclassified Mesorhizobium TaxID=325217 RepID=UPI0024156C63|nr:MULTISPECIES: RHE_PE00001 family protein [unclassified Mesorhizobium]MDG4890006.1 RHE_PE00001 family protein [Mesorhizobium sp. WSM4887]MDG4904148.1 RHE_PE00001 family protein [Mesorhizobium sp. WSM4962]MDG4909175.1 RHE_PE00001 family protein [Mesorhizobium sp. WSM4898]MDG4921799.1 RHE_PE00001 family protein [Mesorhizobium sp. WSM4989]